MLHPVSASARWTDLRRPPERHVLRPSTPGGSACRQWFHGWCVRPGSPRRCASRELVAQGRSSDAVSPDDLAPPWTRRSLRRPPLPPRAASRRRHWLRSRGPAVLLRGRDWGCGEGRRAGQPRRPGSSPTRYPWEADPPQAKHTPVHKICLPGELCSPKGRGIEWVPGQPFRAPRAHVAAWNDEELKLRARNTALRSLHRHGEADRGALTPGRVWRSTSGRCPTCWERRTHTSDSSASAAATSRALPTR